MGILFLLKKCNFSTFATYYLASKIYFQQKESPIFQIGTSAANMNVISKEVERLNTFSINQESGQEQFHIANQFDVQHWRSWTLTFESWASITASKDKLPSYAPLVMLWLDQNPYNVAQMANGKKTVWWMFCLILSKVLDKIFLIVELKQNIQIKFFVIFESSTG